MSKTLIEKVCNVLDEANRAVTVGYIVDRLVVAGDPFTKNPKHSDYVELGYHKTVLQSMTADVHTAIKSAEDAKLHNIVIDRSVRPLKVSLKSGDRPAESYINISFKELDNGKQTQVTFKAQHISISDMYRAISVLETSIKDELEK